jgi:lipopolysaccharide export system permease protein
VNLVGRFALVSFPETMQWTIPIGLLVASILVFSRLSADSEIAAMRACGVNIVSVVRWPVIFGVLCTLIGFYINNEIVPRGHEMRRTLKSRVSVGAGLGVLEPGRVISDFPKVKIYFGAKEGNWLYDLVVLDYSNPRVDRMITAEKALVTQMGADVNFELYRMTLDPVDESHPTMARAGRFVYTMKDVIKKSSYKRKIKDFRTFETLAAIGAMKSELATLDAADKVTAAKADFLRCEISEMRVEFNKRLVFAMASLCFILIGIPLGIRSQRKESTVGMAISLAVSLGYYMLVILMLTFDESYSIFPHIVIWLPVAACLAISTKLICKHL